MTGNADTAAKESILRYLQARPGEGATATTLAKVSGGFAHIHDVLDELEAEGLVTWVGLFCCAVVQQNDGTASE